MPIYLCQNISTFINSIDTKKNQENQENQRTGFLNENNNDLSCVIWLLQPESMYQFLDFSGWIESFGYFEWFASRQTKSSSFSAATKAAGSCLVALLWGLRCGYFFQQSSDSFGDSQGTAIAVLHRTRGPGVSHWQDRSKTLLLAGMVYFQGLSHHWYQVQRVMISP